MRFVFKNLILLYSDQQNISLTHVAIFRVANARKKYIYLVRQDNYKIKIILFCVTLLLNCERVVIIKYQNLKTVICSMIL
jgi:hypothetical protein